MFHQEHLVQAGNQLKKNKGDPGEFTDETTCADYGSIFLDLYVVKNIFIQLIDSCEIYDH